MIRKEAVKEFLAQPRESFDWIKEASRKDLMAAIKEICPQFETKTQLFTHQLASLYIGLCFDGFLYFLDMGLGKEQPLTSKILTPSGWKLMGDICVGDEICHPNGTTSVVLNTFPQGVKDVYKVTFTDGSSTECGEEHLWSVITGAAKSKGRDYQIKSFSELKTTYLTTDGKPIYYIPTIKNLNLCEKFFPIDPYLLGLLLGDGHIGKSVWLTMQESDLTEIINYIKVPHGVETKLDENKTILFFKSTYLKRIGLKKGDKSATLIKFANALDIVRIHHDKKIPSQYLFGSDAQRLALLQGLMDTDGTVSPKGDLISFVSTSIQLCEDVTALVRSLGGIAKIRSVTISTEPNYIYGRLVKSRLPQWQVIINLPKDKIPFRLKRKVDRFLQRQFKYSPTRAIKDIQYVGKKECQCIRVDNPDGLYITDEYIVTHNTAISLSVIQARLQLKQIKTALVVVPNLVNVESWLEEINKFTNFNATPLIGDKRQRLLALEENTPIKIVNYDGLPIFTTDFKENSSKKGTRKRTLNKKSLRSFAVRFQMMILDEIHHVKHTNTLTYQICNELANVIPYRLGMTGTPVGRDPANFWAQFHVIDRGETLGTNKTIFLQALFKPQANYWGGMDWIFPEKNKPVLHGMLGHRSIRYADHECNDLPPLSMIKMPLVLAPDARAIYRQLVLDSVEQAKGNSADAKQQRKNYYSKTRQVASGFLYEDVDDERIALTFTNHKLDALEEILQDVPDDCKVVIFHVFNQSGIDIITRLKKLKYNYAAMNVTAEGSKVDEYKKFKQNVKTQILVVNIASGGEGLNLQNANYCVMYEHTDRPDVFRQALKRCHRTGQQKKVYVYQLYMKNTVEMKILEFLEEGKSLFSAVVDGKMDLKELLMDE